MKRVLAAAAILALGVSGYAVVPETLQAAKLAISPRDEAAVADYRLSSFAAADVSREMETALAAGDAELAQSLKELARSRGVTVEPALEARIVAAVEDADARMLAEAWNGFLTGDTSSEAALAGSLGADFSGYGDLRDLYEQIGLYRDGKPVDELVVGLAAVGLVLTGATVASLGTASPAKAGVSAVKMARRTGRLSPALTRQVASLTADAVDRRALDAMASAVARFDLVTARAAAAGVVRPGNVRAIARLGEDLATVGRTAGYRGMTQTLAVAKSADEVAQVAKLSARYGTRTRGALALLGGAALSFASVALTAGAWLVTGLVWFLLAALAAAKVTMWLARGTLGLTRLGRRLASGGSQASRS